MPLAAPTLLLFGLNLLDALLTIIWVRAGVATEGNQLMASLLDMGNGPFLAAKIAVGAVAAVVLLRWGSRPLARYGVAVALAVYISLSILTSSSLSLFDVHHVCRCGPVLLLEHRAFFYVYRYTTSDGPEGILSLHYFFEN